MVGTTVASFLRLRLRLRPRLSRRIRFSCFTLRRSAFFFSSDPSRVSHSQLDGTHRRRRDVASRFSLLLASGHEFDSGGGPRRGTRLATSQRPKAKRRSDPIRSDPDLGRDRIYAMVRRMRKSYVAAIRSPDVSPLRGAATGASCAAPHPLFQVRELLLRKTGREKMQPHGTIKRRVVSE